MTAGVMALIGCLGLTVRPNLSGSFLAQSYFVPVADGGPGPISINASVRYNPDGTVTTVPGQGGGFEAYSDTVPDWASAGVAGAGYWVRFTQVSGAAFNTGVALNVWHQLDVTRSVGYVTSGTSRAGVVRVEIAPSLSGVPILGTGLVQISRSQIPI